ncbi:RyR domain-containing protein [Pseudomonas flavescens]|uniref:RyR domain-containing protein n=1 Tax=Phytopseudomonas flavescens TaxID=29435 RepID=A0A1G7XPB0_9GAMM|nr:RyR domain-containing protein [Pseudomonas flavescens]SDG85916.1 RyR domain-containing protein [Pseudomonas flavescens]
MKVIVIAGIAHAILSSLKRLAGEEVIAWADTEESYQQGLVAGVTAYVADPELTPEAEHKAWLEARVADGWTHGSAFDAGPKNHPLILPFEELPQDHKNMAVVLHATVHALKDIPDADDAVAIAVAELTAAGQATPAAASVAAALPAGHIPVQYIGRRESFTDHLYGTGLVFSKDQVRNLPGDLARKFLRHADQFQECQAVAVAPEPSSTVPADDTDAKLAAAQKAKEDEQKEQDQLNDLRQQIGVMTKDALFDYAFTRYQQKLDKRASVDSLRQQVIGLVDQYGPV